MTDKLIYIPRDNTQNTPFCRIQEVVETFGLKPTNQNSIKVPKIVETMIRKTLVTILIGSAEWI